MRRLHLLLAATAVAAVPGNAAAQAPLVEQVRWLTGCWEGDVGNGRFYEEVWLAPRGGTISGVSRTTRGERTTGHESLRILEENGVLVYHAHPLGQAAAKFAATAVSDSMVVFANPEHDFPQRITYRRHGPDSLLARVEGPGPNGTHTVDFPMRRGTCPGG